MWCQKEERSWEEKAGAVNSAICPLSSLNERDKGIANMGRGERQELSMGGGDGPA